MITTAIGTTTDGNNGERETLDSTAGSDHDHHPDDDGSSYCRHAGIGSYVAVIVPRSSGIVHRTSTVWGGLLAPVFEFGFEHRYDTSGRHF